MGKLVRDCEELIVETVRLGSLMVGWRLEVGVVEGVVMMLRLILGVRLDRGRRGSFYRFCSILS